MRKGSVTSVSWHYTDNCFDIIRLFSALLIMHIHITIHLNYILSFPMLTFIQDRWCGLFSLFVISGYFIPASLERSKSKKEYIKKRVCRIYPELWGAFIVSFAAVLILGVGYSGLHFTLTDMFLWVVEQITFLQFDTPKSLRQYGVGPNGSLWTISMEIQIYILVMLFYDWLKRQKVRVWLLLIGMGYVCNIAFPFTKDYFPDFAFILIKVTFLPYLYVYLLGMFVYTFREKMIPLLKKKFWGILFASIIWGGINNFIGFSLGHYTNVIRGTLVSFLTLALGYKFGRCRLRKDYSYSLYLYHMVVVNALLILSIKESLLSVVLAYLITILLSFISVTWIGPIGKKLLEKVFVNV